MIGLQDWDLGAFVKLLLEAEELESVNTLKLNYYVVLKFFTEMEWK